MQREVLDYLYAQGDLVLTVFPGTGIPLEALTKFALALNAGASFVLFDFSGRTENNAPTTLAELFSKTLSEDNLKTIESQRDRGFIFSGFESVPDTEDAFRKFYHNLQLIKKIIPHTVGILRGDEPTRIDGKIVGVSKVILIDSDKNDDAAAFIEDSTELRRGNLLWLSGKLPQRKRFPKAVKAIKHGFTKNLSAASNFKENPEVLAEDVKWIVKGEILRKNPMEGLSRLFRNAFPLLLIITLFIPFVYPTSVDPSHSNMRDRIPERNKLSVAPSFDYTFDGKENLWRIARYAIGRFNAIVTDEKMIRQYIDETISDNGYKGMGWENNIRGIPPQGTVIKFSRPDNLQRASADSIGAAWKYWTSILSDSISYITEMYHEKQTSLNRKHNGIDLASRQGARILAPFSAKAYTSKDERGGAIIGLVREKDVILFMHCDQLLYLDGQEVMQGDPIATVGMTGHTTGPHAHIVTGVIDKRGKNRIGNVKYKIIDPIAWYYKFKPNAQ